MDRAKTGRLPSSTMMVSGWSANEISVSWVTLEVTENLWLQCRFLFINGSSLQINDFWRENSNSNFLDFFTCAGKRKRALMLLKPWVDANNVASKAFCMHWSFQKLVIDFQMKLMIQRDRSSLVTKVISCQQPFISFIINLGILNFRTQIVCVFFQLFVYFFQLFVYFFSANCFFLKNKNTWIFPPIFWNYLSNSAISWLLEMVDNLGMRISSTSARVTWFSNSKTAGLVVPPFFTEFCFVNGILKNVQKWNKFPIWKAVQQDLHFHCWTMRSSSSIVHSSLSMQIVILFIVILAGVGRPAKIRTFPIDPNTTFFQ